MRRLTIPPSSTIMRHTEPHGTMRGYDMISGITKYNLDKGTATQTVSDSKDIQTIAFNASFNYNRTFGDAHNFHAMLLATTGIRFRHPVVSSRQQREPRSESGYDYMNKYYAQLSGAAIHSTKLAPGHRNAFSPTATLRMAHLAGRLAERCRLAQRPEAYGILRRYQSGYRYRKCPYVCRHLHLDRNLGWGWGETN